MRKVAGGPSTGGRLFIFCYSSPDESWITSATTTTVIFHESANNQRPAKRCFASWVCGV